MTYLFVYGSLLLPEFVERFKINIIASVFLQNVELIIEKSPGSHTNYHFIKLRKTKKDNIIPGFLISTTEIEAIDKWEGIAYQRRPVIVNDRRLNKIECYAYFESSETIS